MQSDWLDCVFCNSRKNKKKTIFGTLHFGTVAHILQTLRIQFRLFMFVRYRCAGFVVRIQLSTSHIHIHAFSLASKCIRFHSVGRWRHHCYTFTQTISYKSPKFAIAWTYLQFAFWHFRAHAARITFVEHFPHKLNAISSSIQTTKWRATFAERHERTNAKKKKNKKQKSTKLTSEKMNSAIKRTTLLRVSNVPQSWGWQTYTHTHTHTPVDERAYASDWEIWRARRRIVICMRVCVCAKKIASPTFKRSAHTLRYNFAHVSQPNRWWWKKRTDTQKLHTQRARIWRTQIHRKRTHSQCDRFFTLISFRLMHLHLRRVCTVNETERDATQRDAARRLYAIRNSFRFQFYSHFGQIRLHRILIFYLNYSNHMGSRTHNGVIFCIK